MRKLWIFVLIAGIAIVAMSVFQYMTRLSSGDLAPHFTLPSVAGKPVALDGFKGRPILLHFFATWCGPCQAEFPSLKTVQKKFSDKDLIVIAVSEDEDMVALKGFVDYMKPDFPVVVDDGNVANSYSSFAVPETFLIDGEGVILWRHTGPLDWASQSAYDKIAASLNN